MFSSNRKSLRPRWGLVFRAAEIQITRPDSVTDFQGRTILIATMKHQAVIALICAAFSAGLAATPSAATPAMPQGRTVKEMMPSEPFPSTYPGFENQKSQFPAQLEGSGEFVVTRVASVCAEPTNPINFAMEAEHFIRMGNQTVAAELEKRNIDWEMCEASVVGQKLKVVRLQLLAMGCGFPFVGEQKIPYDQISKHACFYVPVVEFNGKEQAVASDALDGFEAFAVERLKVYFNQ